jgi:hypothetical protein
MVDSRAEVANLSQSPDYRGPEPSWLHAFLLGFTIVGFAILIWLSGPVIGWR